MTLVFSSIRLEIRVQTTDDDIDPVTVKLHDLVSVYNPDPDYLFLYNDDVVDNNKTWEENGVPNYGLVKYVHKHSWLRLTTDKTCLLAECRMYRDDRVVQAFLDENGDEIIVDIHQVKNKKKEGKYCCCTCEVEKVFDTLLKLVTTHGKHTKGYTTQRRGVVQLLTQHFNRVVLDFILSPYEFALCCLDIYQYTNKLIHADYIEKFLLSHLQQLDQQTNLDDDSFDQIEKLHQDLFYKNFKNEKNRALREYLNEDDSRRYFHIDHVIKYCNDNNEIVCNKVRHLFPKCRIDCGTSKSAYRLKQKYEEYSQEYLKPGVHVYKKFKDLFRGSIESKEYIKVLRDRILPDPDVPYLPIVISSISTRKTGNYKACYVILNISSLNFELKVVNSLTANQESHLWYELKRNNSLENLEEFIRRQIPHLPPAPKIY